MSEHTFDDSDKEYIKEYYKLTDEEVFKACKICVRSDISICAAAKMVVRNR